MISNRTGAAEADAFAAVLEAKPRQREAKGERPFFLDNPDVDRLLAIVTALVGEVSVVRERMDTMERLAARGLVATQENIEAFQPDPAVEAERDKIRSAMLGRVYRILISDRKPETERPSYDVVIDQFSKEQEV